MDLDLYLNDEHVASTQERSRGQKVVITYTDDVAARFGGETSLLSCSLPTPGPSTPSNARAFLEGLLTEGRALEAMAARLRAVQLTDGAPSTPRDAVGLLAAFGRECAGAVIAVDRGSSLSPDGGGYEALDEASVGALISGLPRAPLGINPEAGVRMSLAGAQPKLLLARFDGAWYEPYNGAASTHILKPTQRWPLSADNEAIVMALARAIGLCEHDTWVETIEDVRVFVTARYDRHISPGTRTVTRRHQEDMCQALGVSADFHAANRPSLFGSSGEFVADGACTEPGDGDGGEVGLA
jgi:serine/threonine-protein kinase HipA